MSGPLKVGNSLVDAFTLQYYEGFPKDQVAWGEIASDKQWQVLSKLKNGYQDSLLPRWRWRKTSPNRWLNISITRWWARSQQGEVTLLVGHDSNIASLLTALDFKPYQLPGQYERTPIGGKLLFQRWHDSAGNRDLMKIEYVYQSTEQLRNADALTLQTPPQRVTLALNGCPVDDQGFCPLETFKKVINEAAK
ncbi:glucose-1-phosphatase [Klebsiella pneumoniae]|uniref:Glucose-1-phosphatase n=1 Tax=Klebsiella pneumoniae TaxID=573 RepID=A0A2X1RF87_KLEPN|nr:glucose-1-phosphatase [Klebsiella pneumoniae]